MFGGIGSPFGSSECLVGYFTFAPTLLMLDDDDDSMIIMKMMMIIMMMMMITIMGTS